MFSQTSLTFSANVGSTTPQTVPVTISSTSSALSYTIAYSSPPFNWLSGDQTAGVATSTGSTGKVNITINPSGLAAGVYSGAVIFSYQNGVANSSTIPVTLTVLTASTLVTSPTSLSFSAQINGLSPLPQSLTISAQTAGTTFNVSASTSSGGSWLSVNPGSAQTSSPPQPNVQVTANPAGLAVGTYNGTVSITSTASSPLVVPVVLTVSAQPVLTVSQNNLAFFYQINTYPTDVQAMVNLNTGNIPVAYTVLFNPSSTSSPSCGNWLSFGPTSGTTTTNPSLSVSAITASFTQPATCSGTLTISAPAATNPTTTIAVSLTVGTSPFLQVSPLSVAFSYQTGGAFPAMQNLSISSSSGTQAYTATVQYATAGASWLQIGTATGNTLPASTVSLSANPAGLMPGTYSATVNITAANVANSVSIPVTLTVSANSMLTFSPPYVFFTYQTGQSLPGAQTVNVGSTGSALPFVVAVPSSGTGQFLSVSPTTGTTPATLTLAAAPGALVPGTYTNSVIVTPIGATSNNPQTIAATLVVSATPLANVSPSALSFNYSGTVPAAQQLAVTSTSTNIPFTFSTSGEPWLVVTNPGLNGTAQATPANLTVQIAPFGLAFGTYTSTIMITAGGFTQPVPVTLNVSSGVTISAAPAALSLTQQFGVAAPVSLPVAIQTSAGTIGVSVTAGTSTGGPWLSVSPSSITAPGTVTATASAAGLAQGTYTGTITFSAAGSQSITVPVTFTVTPPPTVTATPIGLTFTGTMGAANPAAQNLQVTSPNPTQFTASATTATGGNWLTVSGAALTTPAAVPVSVNLSGLAAGTYNGNVILTPMGGGTAFTVPVTLTVNAAPLPTYTQLSNAASYASGSIAPGEIVSLFGTALGPVTPLGFSLTPTGTVPTTLGGVTVTFNGIAAPLTYVSAKQINCIVPFELAAPGVVTAQVVISYNGITSTPQTQTVVPAFPGLFTQNSGGTGLASILRADYSTVTTTNPALRGSTVILYATGGGQTNPGGTTGAIAGSMLLLNTLTPTVLIGGLPATVVYAGSAPSLVDGVLQINVVVPTTANPGVQPVVVLINGVSSQSTATIAVQ